MEPTRETSSRGASSPESRPALSEVGYKAGKEKYERFTAKVDKFVFTVLGGPEMAGEAVKRGWEASVSKANEIKQGAKDKVSAIKETVRQKKENLVNGFFDKVRATGEFAIQTRDKITDKARALGTAAAMTVAAGAGAVAYGVELGGEAIERGSDAVESGFRRTMAEMLSKPHQIAAELQAGWSGIMGEIAKAARRTERISKIKAEKHRQGASFVRQRWATS